MAREIGRACETIGFLVVRGHGVPQGLIADTRAAARELFALPLAEKEAVPRVAPAFNRGYGRVAGESLGRSLGVEAPNDYKESFSIGPPRVPDDAYHTAPDAFPHFAPNRWPARPPRLRPLLETYYEAMERLADDLMRGFALALGLDEGHFVPFIDRHCSSVRLIHYPQQDTPPADGQLRAGAHTDYGSLTVVCTEDVPGGLQVRTTSDGWVDVVPPADGLVVNIGDLMACWTNDRWVSTLHRVANPPPDVRGASTDRVSIVFFHQPNYDARIECLPGCSGPGRPARHAPTTSGAHRLAKLGRANQGPSAR